LALFRNILKEPQINLPKKFDDTYSKFRGFVNQVCIIIQLHQHHYLDDQTQVGLIGTLLLGTNFNMVCTSFGMLIFFLKQV
jgi:hypothetical protein